MPRSLGELERTVGILAYGSLDGDPGEEIGPLIVERIKDIKTPFRVEFARMSRTRGEAPTLVLVSEGGVSVTATVLVLEERISEAEATDMIWRRETRRVGSSMRYDPPPEPGVNEVMVRPLKDFEGLDVVLYAQIGVNLIGPDPRHLAELAIESARSEAGRKGKDGITYLLGVKKNGVRTPLMTDYEKEILRLTGTETLEQAHTELTMRKP